MNAAQQIKIRNTLQGMLVLHSWNMRLIRSLLDELPKEQPTRRSKPGSSKSPKKKNKKDLSAG